MKRPGLIRGIFVLYLVYSGVGVVRRLHRYHIDATIPQIVIESSYLNTSQIAAITDMITTLHLQKNQSVADVIMQVQKQFPYISYGSAQFQAGSLIQYQFKTTSLICRVNQQYVLIYGGILCLDHICEPSVLEALPRIEIAQSLAQDIHELRTVAQAVASLDRSLLDSYTFQWQSADQAFISGPPFEQLHIVCDVQHVPTAQTIEMCKRIQDEIVFDTQKYKGFWLADIRFAKQIIIYRDMGGRYD